ncbi:MAG: tetratricopeptide repeat protein [Acidobacteria bacterium]|nr:tetratricopeptide repeat protein [Acidobacteriota bacterium]
MTAGQRARRLALGLTTIALAGRMLAPVQGAPVRGLTQASALAHAYDLALDADFAAADAELTRVCGPAPAEACEVIGVAGLWWRIYLDLDNRSRDAVFMTRVNASIDRCEQWVAREPERAEAWFYLGAAYGARVQYHGQRGEVLAAARDGKRIRTSLEKALALDPTLHDANFGIGLYQYYADITPAVLKFVRWLLALPGGDKVIGLQQMLRTRSQGVILKADAAYQLHLIYLWYEHEPEKALALLDELRTRYPHNPIFVLNIAQVHEEYRSDRPAALAAYRALVDGARTGAFREPLLAEVWGHAGTAAQWAALAEPDRAIEEWRWVVERRADVPYGAVSRAHLGIGQAYDRMGMRDRAIAAYRAALATVPGGDPSGTRAAAEAGLARTPDRASTDAARLSLDGWRAFERGALAEAWPRLDRAVQLRPGDGVHRYRRGRIFVARQDRAHAQADFERASQVRPSPPPPFVASAFYELGRLAEARGDLARAASLYDSAARVRGAFPETRDSAQQALSRLR